MATERKLHLETIEGEISLVIDYEPGSTVAVDLLQGAMNLIESLDGLDKVLLSSVDTSLEPVSIINDVQHSSLKLLLARALKSTPDDILKDLSFKKWVGHLLVKGKYKLLKCLESGNCDAPEIQKTLSSLEKDYNDAPVGFVGYDAPRVSDVIDALDKVEIARSSLAKEKILIQTELGDIHLPEAKIALQTIMESCPEDIILNKGEEFFKIKQVDMLGNSQWTVLRNNRAVKVDMLHKSWLDKYHNREVEILPGDSLFCKYEEVITYDQNQNEIDRKLSIVEVMKVIRPPIQDRLC